MVSIYTADAFEDDYDKFWTNPNGSPETHEQTIAQHFPPSISVSEIDPFQPFPAYAAPPNITYHRGGYESTELSNQDLLEALRAHKKQLSMLINQLPEHLCRPLMRRFIPPTPLPDYTASGQHIPATTRPFVISTSPIPDYTTSGRPDLLKDETLQCVSPPAMTSGHKPPAFAIANPLQQGAIYTSVQGPGPFNDGIATATATLLGL